MQLIKHCWNSNINLFLIRAFKEFCMRLTPFPHAFIDMSICDVSIYFQKSCHALSLSRHIFVRFNNKTLLMCFEATIYLPFKALLNDWCKQGHYIVPGVHEECVHDEQIMLLSQCCNYTFVYKSDYI